MNSQPQQSDLELAYHTAREANKVLRFLRSEKKETQLMLDMSSMIMESLDCIQGNTNLRLSCARRIARYVSWDAKSPLLKIGYALSILLDKLLTDRMVDSYLGAAPAQKKDARSQDHIEEQPSCSFDSDSPREIKEEPVDEPVEIKTEEPDLFDDVVDVKQEVDDLAEVKEEEQPIADVFCPTTGTSRPVSAIDQPAKMGIASTSREEWSIPQTCFLCSAATSTFWPTPLSSDERKWFLDKVVTHSVRDHARVMALQKDQTTAFFCRSHVKGWAQYANRMHPRPKQDANLTACELCSSPVSPTIRCPLQADLAKKFYQNLVDLTPEQREKIQWFKQNSSVYRRAMVCSKHLKPVEVPQPAQTTATQSSQQNAIERGARKRKPVVKEVQPIEIKRQSKIIDCVPLGRRVCTVETPSNAFVVDYVVDNKKVNRQMRKCHLCGVLTNVYVFSPVYSMFAPKFFDGLIDVTPEQRQAIEWHIRQNRRATVCLKHLKKKESTLVEPKEEEDEQQDSVVKSEY